MAEKVSVKTTTVIFLLGTIILTLCACVNPVDINAFFKDEEYVQKRIEETKAKVVIHKDSDNYADLIPGDCKISGLTAGKYYMLEEYDDSTDKDKVLRTLFIKSDGTYFGDLSGIGRLIGTQVTNLKNFYTYKVTIAKPFEAGNNIYEYFTFGMGNVPAGSEIPKADITKTDDLTTATVGVVGIDPYYLNLAPVINVNGNYEVMAISSTTWGSSSRTSGYYNDAPDNNLEIIDLPPPAASFYRPYQDKSIGIYQYRVNVSTGAVPLQNKSIIALPELGDTPDYIFAQYNSDKNVTQFTFLKVEVKQGVVASDFDIDKLAQEYGSVTAVLITPKEGKSTGDIAIYYEGANGTDYDKSQTLPTELGKYAVTFDVGATADFAATKGLYAGTLVISEGTPVADDYYIDNFKQTEGSVTPVIITAKPGKSNGEITIYYGGIKYDGLNTLPLAVGTYAVTFDVAAAPNWKAVNGLSAGTLTVSPPVSVKINVKFDGFSPEYNPNIDPNITATYTSLNPNLSTFTTTLTLSYISGYDDIRWYKDDGSPLGSGDSSSITLTLSDNSSADVAWWQEGVHYIYLELRDNTNVLPPLSGKITITCTVGP